ncbi:MAG: alanine:cation symporter family protein, partial [Oscillospiraceae bacterium]|nr:alanine:cation symporter family protein [Oscillospiraceae bacterium]
LVISAFSSVLGKSSGGFIAVGIYLFAIATIIGWEVIGETAFVFLFGERSEIYYKYIYIVFILIGATISLENVFYIADIFNALMAVPNIVALCVTGGEPPLAYRHEVYQGNKFIAR